MAIATQYRLRPVGWIRSEIVKLSDSPRQGSEGAPDAWLEIDAEFIRALNGISRNDDIVIITWLHLGDRRVLETYPRNDRSKPLTGVFATRSPDRPNPLGLHRTTVREVSGARLRVGPLEAIDGTPVVDIKAVLTAYSDD